ncbi:MAG: hypothetical protein KKE64_00530, partial [Candidatus Omnitrophica bacterium]|nr:hypothetical protein [Candidatus Omnitrophota bacterium]
LRIFSDASRDEIDRAKNICKNALKEIMVKETGKPAFNIVRETDDSIIIDSHMLGQTGQAAVIINHKEYPIGSFHIKNFPGDHKPGAVILFSGEGILAGQRIINSTIYDIYPTISHYLGLPVNKNMKGRVLLDIFEKKMRKVRYSDNKSRSKKIGANFKPSVPEYNPEQEEEIKDKMRSLGYLN